MRWEIEPDQATVVRRIFAACCATSPKQLRRTPEDAAQPVLVAGAVFEHFLLDVELPWAA
jgi:hypothetical protein